MPRCCKVLALSQCEQTACEANCSVPAGDEGSAFSALLRCQKNADATSCKSYADAATCADALIDGGAASMCAQTGATFADNAKPMVQLFCGGIVADAGRRRMRAIRFVFVAVLIAACNTSTETPPASVDAGGCADALVDCLNNLPDAATCKTFTADAANKPCIVCAITPSTASALGPLVEGTVTIEVNEPGCIARATGDTSATGCGAKVLALGQCEALACEACPPPPMAWFHTCDAGTLALACKTYVDDAVCADALTDGGAASFCALSGTTFADNAKPMMNLFCGGIVADAGDGG